MTQTHPGIPEELRGTYAGLGHPVIIEHLKNLNVTAIELMPVHQFMHDHRLLDLGLRNYWGYNTFGFFAPPHYQYAANQHAGGAVAEFKTMVRSFHDAGIEVILDVVYNHTAEGNHLARRSTSAVSTMPPTTGCSMTTSASTRTSPAPAIVSTPGIRTPCS